MKKILERKHGKEARGWLLKGSIGSFAHKKAQTVNISYC